MKTVHEKIVSLVNEIKTTDYSLTFNFSLDGNVWRVDLVDAVDDKIVSVWPKLPDDERISIYLDEDVKKGATTDVISPFIVKIIASILLAFEEEENEKNEN